MHKVFATFLLISTCALGQGTRQILSANLLIPQPPPAAPLADWTETSTRTKLTETLPDATLRGWDYKARQANAPTILFFNGNGMTVDRADGLYRSLAAVGAEVCVFDYRGIGFSEGKPDVLTFREDALHLYDTVAAARPGRAVIVYGFSLGTAMASYVASQRKVAGLILAGTIATATEEFPAYMHAAGFAPEMTAGLVPGADAIEAFDEIGNVSRSSAPLLMLHGDEDAVVPIGQGREVFAASPATQKKFVALPGTTHNQTAGTLRSVQAVGAFVSAVRAAQ